MKAVLYWYSIVAWIIGWSEIKSDISKVIPYFESPYCVKIGLAYIVFVSVIASLKLAPTIPTYELYIEATPIGNRVKLKLYINYGGALVTTWPFKEDNLSFKINLRDRSDASKRFELSAGSINYSKYSCSGTTTYSFECASGYNFKSPYVESVVFNSQPDGAIVKFIQRWWL